MTQIVSHHHVKINHVLHFQKKSKRIALHFKALDPIELKMNHLAHFLSLLLHSIGVHGSIVKLVTLVLQTSYAHCCLLLLQNLHFQMNLIGMPLLMKLTKIILSKDLQPLLMMWGDLQLQNLTSIGIIIKPMIFLLIYLL